MGFLIIISGDVFGWRMVSALNVSFSDFLWKQFVMDWFHWSETDWGFLFQPQGCLLRTVRCVGGLRFNFFDLSNSLGFTFVLQVTFCLCVFFGSIPLPSENLSTLMFLGSKVSESLNKHINQTLKKLIWLNWGNISKRTANKSLKTLQSYLVQSLKRSLQASCCSLSVHWAIMASSTSGTWSSDCTGKKTHEIQVKTVNQLRL